VNEFIADDSTRIGHSEEGSARPWNVVGPCVVGLMLTIACQSALAQATYRITPVGSVGGCPSTAPLVYGANQADEVTGIACFANHNTHAFLWKNDGTPMVDLGPPEVGSTSEGIAISPSGLVGGMAFGSTGNFAFLSSADGKHMTRIYDGLGGDGITPIGATNNLGQLTGIAATADHTYHVFFWKNDGSPILDLGTLGGTGNSSYASDMNASGQVVGYSYTSGNNVRAFVWKNDGSPMLDLGTLGGDSYAYAINASGQVAGISTLPKSIKPEGSMHAFFWRNDGTPIQDLGTLGGPYSSPSALNDAGQIAGDSTTSGGNIPHLFVWLNDGTPMRDLGSLGGTELRADAINASGQVVGSSTLAGDAVTHAFLWRNDGTKMQDVNKLIDPTDPLEPYVTLTESQFINDQSDIVADGIDSRTGLPGVYLLKSTGATTSALTLTPRSLAFGNVPIDSSSATQSVTVTNTSPNAVAITGIALRGTAPKQFAFTDDCGKSIAGHATCTLKAQFTPSLEGAMTAYLDVNGGGHGLRSVKLTGTGTGTSSNPWVGSWDGKIKSTCGFYSGPFDVVIVSLGMNRLSLTYNGGGHYDLTISSTNPNVATFAGGIVRYTISGNSMTVSEPNACQTGSLTRVH
jgi:probable HAF family extracellular repeat protein